MKNLKIVLLLLFLFNFLNKIHAQGTWSNLGVGIPLNNLGVLALCADTVNNVLYAGGEFDSAGSIKQNSLAKWDGTKWNTTVSIDSGMWVYALIMYKGNLIIGFSDGSIGEYDGTTLQYLPGFNEAVYCFYIYDDTLFAGGAFTQGGVDLKYIAKWSGTEWLPVDRGFSWYNCCADVEAMTEYNGNLIAAGTFDSAGNVAVTSIASYDGSKWNSLGVNLSEWGSTPYNSSLEVYKNKLYVQGLFDSVNSVYNIGGTATWDGTNWDTIFSNTDNSFIGAPNTAMKSFNGYLFDGGRYNYQYPFKYDGNTISTVDSGVIGGINTITEWNGSLYVGGYFDWAVEAIPHTPCIAHWTPDSTTGIKHVANNTKEVSVYPNPTSNQLTITTTQFSISQLQIENVLGQTVLQNYFTSQLPKGVVSVDVSALPQGIYFYRVTGSNSQVVAGKFVLVK